MVIIMLDVGDMQVTRLLHGPQSQFYTLSSLFLLTALAMPLSVQRVV